MTLHRVSARNSVLAATLITISLSMASAQQSNNGRTSVSSNGQPQTAEVRTEKFKVKQEFGPQTVARRDNRTAAATPSAQNGGGSSTGRASKFKQEFGPSVHAARQQNVTTATPPVRSGAGSAQVAQPAAAHGNKPQ